MSRGRPKISRPKCRCIPLSLPDDMVEQIETMARGFCFNRSEMARQAIRIGLGEIEKKSRWWRVKGGAK